MEISTVNASPAQVVRDNGGLETLREGLELGEVAFAEGIGGADVEGDSVEDEGKSRTHVGKDVQRSSSGHHVVLAQGLKEIDAERRGVALPENAGIVLGAQPDTDAQERNACGTQRLKSSARH